MRADPPLIKPAWKGVLWIVAWLSIAAAFLNLASSWAEHDQASNDLHVASSAADKDVRIHGHLNADRLAPGDRTVAWFRVQNVGTRTVAELKIRWSAAGFEKSEFTAPKTILQPGETVDFTTVLTAAQTAQRFTATAEIEWCTEMGSDSETLFLGPIFVRLQSEPRIYAISKMWVDLLKNLALPIVLIIATSLFSTRQRNAEARSASWNLMLEKSHANAEHYYMPLAHAADLLALRMNSADPAKPSTFDVPTFYTLVLYKRYRVMFERIAGFYLNTRAAEDIAAACLDAFSIGLMKWVDQATRSKAKDYVGRYMELHTFKEKVLQKPEVQKVKQGLIRWATEAPFQMNATFAALSIMGEVLRYDINLNYQFWYKDPPEPLAEFGAERIWLRWSGSPDLIEIARKYDVYREEVAAKIRNW
jgi:hypothetical protein